MTQNTQIEAKLLPCPFCGCTDVSNNDDGDYEWYECDWCHATSGFDPEPEFEGLHPSFHWNRRALREAPVPSEEPVAWQWRYKMHGEWSDWNDGRVRGWVKRNNLEFEERALFASPGGAPVSDDLMDSDYARDIMKIIPAVPVAPVAVSVKVAISRDDADVIRRMMEEFFHRKELSPEETTALLNLCDAGDFGRLVQS